MVSNTSSGSPHHITLDDRAAEILTLLNVPDGERGTDLVRRVKTFIQCNGYDGVRRAAAGVGKQIAQDTQFRDSWAFTINAYNANLAHLSILYTLTHLVETSLRSNVDMLLTQAFRHGDWYRTPHLYLRREDIAYFVSDAMQPEIQWETVPGGKQPTQIRALNGSASFMEQLTFGWLMKIVLYGYQPPNRFLAGTLLTPEGKAVSASQAEKLLSSAKNARNAVAHNHYIPLNAYQSAHQNLVTLLQLLRFDLVKAIPRIEGMRKKRMDKVHADLVAASSQAKGQ